MFISIKNLIYIFILTLLEHILVAATYTVPIDYPTLGAAIAAVPSESIIIVNAGTYIGYINAYNTSKNLYIKSQSGVASTILSGGGSSSILRIENGSGGDYTKNLVFDGFTFSNGRGSGTAISPITISDASPQFLNCIFKNNSAPDRGGAVLIYGAKSIVSFINCEFSNNTSDRTAGAVLVNGGHAQAIFKRCLFENNSNRTASANYWNEGGALYFSTAGGKIIDCVFNGNSACYAGGAIMILNGWNQPEQQVVIRGCEFNDNFCNPVPGKDPGIPSEGGAVMIENNLTIDIKNSIFIGNYADAGGAVHSYRGHMNIEKCIFDNNIATGTGGQGYGGAVGIRLNDAGDSDRREAIIKITDTIIRNCTGPVGGGIFCDGDGQYLHHCQLTLNNVTVDSCQSTTAGSSYGNGGGVFLGRTKCFATNSYILNNTAGGAGGGFVIVADTELYLNDSYVIGNSAAADHAIHDPDGSFYTLNNTVLAYNGGGPTYNGLSFAAIPSNTVGNVAALTYFVAPYSTNILISPYVGNLVDQGGYAAGTVLVTGILEETTFTLKSNHSDQETTVEYSGSKEVNPDVKDIPGSIEIEDFDQGGEGLAYHDTTVANLGGAYRPSEGVDIVAVASASNGYLVGWIAQGEWMEYSVNVVTSDMYDISVRLASPTAGQRFRMYNDGDLLNVFTVPNTGGWGVWGTVTKTNIYLSKGAHVVSIVIENRDFDLDNIVFERQQDEPHGTVLILR